MNPSPTYNWQLPQRQAIAGLFIILYKTFVRIVKVFWPILVVLLFRKSGRQGFDMLGFFVAAIPVFVLVRSIVEFFYFRFYIAGDELVIKKGFINRKHLALPFTKIQAVHIEQDLLHQLTQCGKVIIDTAGTEKTEAVIDAISMDKAEQLKVFLLKVKGSESTLPESPVTDNYKETTIVTLSFWDLLKLGISSNHIQTFFIVLAFAFSVFQNVQETFGNDWFNTVKENVLVRALVNSIPLIVILVLTISVFVSLIRILLKYFDFRLTESDQGLKLKSGLINIRQFLVPIKKIQYIGWKANWVRRRIGMYTLELHQAAGEKIKEKNKIKIPITRKTYIDRLLVYYHQQVIPAAHSVHKIHRAFIFRRTLFVAIIPVGLLLLVLGLINWSPWLLLLLLWIPYTAVNAWFYQRNFRLFIAPDALQVNSGVWGRDSRVLQWYKIQQVILQQTIYQRNHALATVKLVTAGGLVQIPYVSLALAQAVNNYAMYQVEQSRRHWM